MLVTPCVSIISLILNLKPISDQLSPTLKFLPFALMSFNRKTNKANKTDMFT